MRQVYLFRPMVFALVLAVSVLASLAPASAAPPEQVHDRTALREAVERQLQRELAFWYPAAVDEKVGGFRLVQMDSPVDDPLRTVVYQARVTWTAATIAIHQPAKAEQFKPYVNHGLAFLRNVMWDARNGGFFWAVHRDGNGSWVAQAEKHTYGNAFGIYAAAEVYKATHNPEALQLAQDTFNWLEAHAHDPVHGGYFDALALDGTPILTAPAGQAVDCIGTHYGYKSMNNSIHMLEALTGLYEVWPDSRVKARLAEMLQIAEERFAVAPGVLHMELHPDWRAVPGPTSYGHNVETAYLLIEAARSLHGGKADEATHRLAKQLVDHSLSVGWDSDGKGFFECGSTFGAISDRKKSWWAQAEGVHTLLMMDQRYGNQTSDYQTRALELWNAIQSSLLVGDRGAWWCEMDAGPRNARNWQPNVWQANYHTVRAQLHALQILSGDR